MKKLFPIAVLLTLQLAASAVSAGSAATPAADGIALYNQKQYPQAAAVLGQQISHCKTPAQLPTLYYYLACAYYGMNKLALADQTFRYIRNTYPTSNEARLSGSMLSTIASATAAASVSKAISAAANGAGSSHSLFSSSNPSSTGSPRTEPARTASTSSAEPARHRDERGYRSTPEEMATLPDTGKFYFKRNENGHMAVTAMINGRPVPCWFDTGAGAHFGRSQLQSAGVDLSKAEPDGYTHGWAGKPVEIWKLPVTVQLGTIKRKMTIWFEDSADMQLLGQDFIDGYQYEVDDKANVVNLRKSFTVAGQTDKTDALYDVPCELKRGDDFFTMQVNGKPCEAFIDTGSWKTIISPGWAKKLGIEITDDMERVSTTGVGGSTQMVATTVNLRVGPIYRPDFPILIGGSLNNCIGQDFMSGWRFKVDREKKMMRFFH